MSTPSLFHFSNSKGIPISIRTSWIPPRSGYCAAPVPVSGEEALLPNRWKSLTAPRSHPDMQHFPLGDFTVAADIQSFITKWINVPQLQFPLKKINKKNRCRQNIWSENTKSAASQSFPTIPPDKKNTKNMTHSNDVPLLMGRCSFVAVTSPPNNLNHHLNYSHNNDTRALHYEHYCWEMGPTEVKDESYLSLSVGTLVMVTGPSDLCWGFSLSSTRQIYHQITGWCQCPLHKMGWPSIAVWLRSL